MSISGSYRENVTITRDEMVALMADLPMSHIPIVKEERKTVKNIGNLTCHHKLVLK